MSNLFDEKMKLSHRLQGVVNALADEITETLESALDRITGKILLLESKADQTESLIRRKQYLERLLRAIPLLARRRKLFEQKQALGPFRPLPPDFSATRSGVQQKLRSTVQRLEQLNVQQEQVCTSLKQLSLQTSLVNRTSDI